jgi:hypothetical protein
MLLHTPKVVAGRTEEFTKAEVQKLGSTVQRKAEQMKSGLQERWSKGLILARKPLRELSVNPSASLLDGFSGL